MTRQELEDRDIARLEFLRATDRRNAQLDYYAFIIVLSILMFIGGFLWMYLR